MESEVNSFTVESVIIGYVCVPHLRGGVVKCIRVIGLVCSRDTRNRHDPFAVATYKGTTVVRHVPSLLLSC